MISQARQWMNEHPVAVTVIAVVCLLGGLTWIYTQTFGGDGSEPPQLVYRCVNGHEWGASLSGKPVCPDCGEPGIYNPQMICTNCNEVVRPLERKKLGPGEQRYRIPGEDEWLKRYPRVVECPNCGEDRAYGGPNPGFAPASEANKKKLVNGGGDGGTE
jgi:predicted RNA-binding Zn-ribbon protein involved in translation (DUF1610 family)